MLAPVVLDELFLDALVAVGLDAPAKIGDESRVRFAFFRKLLAAAQEEAGGRYTHRLTASPDRSQPALRQLVVPDLGGDLGVGRAALSYLT